MVHLEASLEGLDPNQLHHSVIVVKSSEKALSWTMDVTGAQYSIFDVCLPEAMYQKRHVAATISAFEIGRKKAIFKAIKTMEGDMPLLARISLHAANKISTGISDWKAKSNFSLPELLRQEEGNFVEERKELMEAIEASLENFATDVAVRFKADIEDTDQYMTENAWKWKVGLCPYQDVLDVIGLINHTHRLY